MRASGICDDSELRRARALAISKRARIDKVLVETGILTETDLAKAYADLLDTLLVYPDQYPKSPVLPEVLKGPFARLASVVPLAVDNGNLIVAVADGLADWILPFISAAVEMPVKLRIGIPAQLEAAVSRLYPQPYADMHSAHHDWMSDNERHRSDFVADAAPAVKIVNQLISRAIELYASDIHIEPTATRLVVRVRVDGMLREQEQIVVRLSSAIVSRIKIMARLDISERRLPQDGQFSFVARGDLVHLRVSIVPSLYGEKVALRIFGSPPACWDRYSLRLPREVEGAWRRVLEEPNGLILVTGPTGSGKTTTLYNSIRSIAGGSRNIMTIEEPIESAVEGICQLETKPNIGQTFPKILRSILRQDPDVIMVGEIRDSETASIAVQAATTGHLVLSSLHTNTAAGAITRLRDLGVADYLLASVLRGVLAQRLARHVCSDCTQLIPDHFSPITLHCIDSSQANQMRTEWQFRRCRECHGTRYKGRIAIAEFLLVRGKVERLIRESASESELQSAAAEEGMRRLGDCANEAVRNGITTMEEVRRILGPGFADAQEASLMGQLPESRVIGSQVGQ